MRGFAQWLRVAGSLWLAVALALAVLAPHHHEHEDCGHGDDAPCLLCQLTHGFDDTPAVAGAPAPVPPAPAILPLVLADVPASTVLLLAHAPRGPPA